MKKTFTLLLSLIFVSFWSFAQEVGTTYEPVVSENTYFDVSLPLTEIGPIPPTGASGHHQHKNDPSIPKLNNETVYKNLEGALPKGDDPAWQMDFGGRGISPPIQNFQGVRNDDNGGYSDLIAPPDTDGDVGPNHYFQMCNTIFEIFDKSGNTLFGPADNSTIWDGFIGDWTGTNDGDPIVLYDEQADRWLVSQFAVDTDVTGGTYWILVAISTSSNPMGSYYRYAFEYTNYPDYPKFGIWRDGYYLMVQHGNGTATASALNRSQMIAGNATAQRVTFSIPNLPGSGFSSVLPADNDGQWAPSGTPNYFVYFSDDAWGGDPVDRLKVWEFDVNWTFTWASSLTLTQNLNTASFSSAFGTHNQGIIPQPGTTRKLAVVEKALMNRLHYRNFGTYQSMVCCHTVDVDGANRAGIRWYELRKTTGSWYIYQQGTYAPGTTDNYWMASIAQNASGDIALGYSVSSSSTFPSIRYTGRKLGDPLGQMTMGEGVIMNGADSQEGTSRWGDYTMMSIDPSDDETFWYTNEFNDDYTTWGNWITQVASFKIDDYCSASGGCAEYIQRVQIGSIDNTSACEGYSNFTDMSNDIPLNGASDLTVTIGNYFSGDDVTAWVDWNRDGDFVDASEEIGYLTGAGPHTFSISPPAGATIGECTMRIRLAYYGDPPSSPCGTTSFGEVEDYTINVTSAATNNTWIGVTSTDWHTGSNWSLGTVPTSTTAVTIPAGTPYQPVIGSGAYASSLYLNTGATLTQNSGIFHVYGTFDAGFGQFTMTSTNAYLYLQGNNNSYWWDDNQNDTYTTVVIYKDNVDNTVTMPYDATISHIFQVYVGTFTLSTSVITGTSTESDAFMVNNNGKIILDSSSDGLTTAGSMTFFNGSQATMTDGTIRCAKDFTVLSNTLYNIAFTGGTLIMDGSSTQYIDDQDGGTLDLNNLTIAKSGGTCYIKSANLDVNGNMSITGGALSCNNAPSRTSAYNINVAGNWTNTVGEAGFEESTGRVIFNGPGHQYIYGDETFNILEVNNGAALRLNNASYDVTCNVYDWTTGGIDIIAGNFTALDLNDNGLFGGYWVNPGGTINLTNDGWVDLRGELHNFGGIFNVSGTISDWPYNGDATVEMTAGVIDFKTCGITIKDNSYDLTTNISGGTIRTAYSFINERADADLSAATIEMYGPGESTLDLVIGGSIQRLEISKGAKDGLPELKITDRNGNPVSDGGRADNVTLASDVNIEDDLIINEGSLTLNGYELTVDFNVNVSGTLIMNNPADVLNIGYEIEWNSGSVANITQGQINLERYFHIYDGSNVQIGTGNTLNLIGSVETSIHNLSATSEIGNVNVSMPSGTSYVHAGSTQPVHIIGNMTVNSGNHFKIQSYDLIVDGILDIKSGATMDLGSIFDAGYLESNGTLQVSGTLITDFGSSFDNPNPTSPSIAADYQEKPGGNGGSRAWFPGEVFAHGNFTFSNTGTISILGGGTFIWDQPIASGVNSVQMLGLFNLDDGTFEVSDKSVQFYGTSNINGGLIRVARTFNSTLAGAFEPAGGTVELISPATNHYIQVTNGNYFNNLTINRSAPIQVYIESSLVVKNDLTINGGALNSNSRYIYVGGDWLNNLGPDAFFETGSRVIFNGSGAQFCSTEDFNILEIDKPSSLLYNVAYSQISCQVYDWTSGGIWISPGNFDAADLADAGLFGTIGIWNGTMNLHQDGDQFADINGDITVGTGGTLNVYGGNGDSFWPYAANASITMNGGVLDFKDVGIYISDDGFYSLTENITGGIIRTVGNLHILNPAFTPSGGTMDLYGGLNTNASMVAGSNIFSLTINKTGVDNSNPINLIDHEGKPIERTRGDQVTVNGNFLINGLLSVNAGKLYAGTSGDIITCVQNAGIDNAATLELGPGAQLKLNTSLNIYNGGTFRSSGVLGNEAVVTRAYASNYTFAAESGGNIGADNTIFEYMGANGINIMDGALVDPAQAFNNCTFRLGQSGNTLLTMNSTQDLECTGATFPTNSWGGAYNVSKSNNSGRITFNDYSGPYSGPSYENDPYNRIDWFVPELSASPLSRTVSPPAGSTTFNITSNLEWTVSESVSWLSVTPMSGSNNGVITVNYLQNASASNRSGIITLSAADVPNVTLTVTQAGVQLTVNPAIQNVAAPAGSTNFNVVSNAAWTVSESSSWFSVSPSGGTGNGTLNVNYAENTSVTPRSGTLTISSSGVPSVTVTVNQAGADPVLSVTPASRSVSAAAGSTTFGIESNTSWTVSESVAWFTVAPMSGSGNNTLTVNYQQNSSVTPRSGQITVFAAGVPDVVVTVNQAGAGATLTVSPSNRNVTPPAGNTTFSVSSNTSWAVSESVAWLNVTPMNGSGNVTLTVNYGENATGTSRIGSITVTATGGSPSQTVTVTQESYPTHLINVPEGWSGLSSYIMPANNDITDVFSPVSGSFVIATTMTGIYYPAGPVNTIIDWESQSAYKLKMSAAASLPVIGNEETNKTFDMLAGWSLMPVISNAPVDAADLFAGADLKIVKDVAGVGMLWPEYGINTLGVFVPGRTYTVKMNSFGSVTFPPNVKNAGGFEIPQTILPSNPWDEIHNGPSTHSIAIIAEGISGAMPGDVIGLFDESGKCYGVAEIANLKDNAAINAFADDPYTYDKDGFEANDLMDIKLFRPANAEVYPVEVVWDDQQPDASYFESEGISVISNFKVSSVGINEALASSIQIRPNPSNGLVEISGIEKFNYIEIFNSGGTLIRTLSNDENSLKLNLSDLPSGVYQVKFTGVESSVVKKLIRK